MLRLLTLVSTIRCFLLYHAGFQLERYHVLVAQLPHLAGGIPLPTCLLHLAPQLHLGKADAHSHNRVRGKTRLGRFPRAFRNNQLHGLEPLLTLRIVAIAHTDKTVTILREQLLRAFLAWFEM
jgi:hypothetical protein